MYTHTVERVQADGRDFSIKANCLGQTLRAFAQHILSRYPRTPHRICSYHSNTDRCSFPYWVVFLAAKWMWSTTPIHPTDSHGSQGYSDFIPLLNENDSLDKPPPSGHNKCFSSSWKRLYGFCWIRHRLSSNLPAWTQFFMFSKFLGDTDATNCGLSFSLSLTVVFKWTHSHYPPVECKHIATTPTVAFRREGDYFAEILELK